MATLSVQDVTTAGTVPTFAAATSGGDQFQNDGKTIIVFRNGGATKTITIASQIACNQGSTHNLTVTVTSGGEAMVGPLDTSRYNDSSSYAQVTYSTVASLTAGVFQI